MWSALSHQIGRPQEAIATGRNFGGLGGGGARSPLWRQIQADVYGHAVEIVEAEEGAAYGAAILAGVGSGMWPSVDAACNAAVRIACRVKPQPAAVATLNASYSAFRRIYPATRDILGPH